VGYFLAACHFLSLWYTPSNKSRKRADYDSKTIQRPSGNALVIVPRGSMERIMQKYIILSAIQFDSLMELVNEALDAGYICQGGVTVCAGPNGQRVAQAMVRSSGLGN
jgi:hypothetical protein